MTKPTEMILGIIIRDIQAKRETDNATLYNAIIECYKNGITWDDIYQFGFERVQVIDFLLTDMASLIILAETALVGKTPYPPGSQFINGGTRTFATECFKQAKSICDWLANWVKNNGDSITTTRTEDIGKRLLAFLDNTLIYGFNLIDRDGDALIPVTKGFCQQPPISKESTEIDLYKKLLVIKSGYLEPMLHYFDRTELRAKARYNEGDI